MLWEAEGQLVTKSTTSGGQPKAPVPFHLAVQDPADPAAARARLEVNGGPVRLIRVCNGTEQWKYLLWSRHYWKVAGPGIGACAYPFTEWINLAHDLHAAAILGKENLDIGDREVECTIVQGDFDAGNSDLAGRRTLWIADSTQTIWKYRIEHSRGESDLSVQTYTFSWQALAGIRRPKEFWKIPAVEGATEVSSTDGEEELTAVSAPPVSSAELRNRIGASPPALVHTVEPNYTEEARQARIQGKVILTAVIGLDGKASDFRIVQSLDPGLDQKAIEAVRQWEFRPGMRDGTPVAAVATIEINFILVP